MNEVIEHLKNGGVIAYPTETLWGLGSDIYDQRAVANIFKIKGRELEKAVSVLVQDVHQAKTLAEISPEVEELLYTFWPGPITFVLPVKNGAPAYLSPNGKIGLRCSSDPVLRELMRHLPSPIVTTSANKSGEPPARNKADLEWLSKDVLIFQPERELPESRGSTVVMIEEKNIRCLREGDLPVEKVKSVVGSHGFSVV